MRICKECHKLYKRTQYRYHLHGKNHPRYGVRFKCSEETKRKMSIVRQGRSLSKEHCRRISEGLKGHFVSQETKRKIQIANEGGNSDKMKQRWKDGVYDDVNFHHYSKQGIRKDIGHFVRSTWEANFARILNYSGIEYEYEPTRFDLRSMTYLPDFYLPEKDMYVEIKGQDSKEAKYKRIMTRKIYGIKIKVIKEERYKSLTRQYKDLVLGWE